MKEVEKPAPKENEVLIKIHATSAHVGDTRIRSCRVPKSQWIFMRLYLGIIKPRKKILGMEISGQIEETGSHVTKFKKGDKVYAMLYPGKYPFGGYAEYKCMPENGLLAIKPKNMTYDQAATLPNGAITALHLMKKGKVNKDQEVLIYGASGSVGTFSVQFAKYLGAKVTGVCSNKNLKMVESLGADETIDYTKEDFSEKDKKYDFILDAGNKLPKSKGKKSIKSNGIYFNVDKDSGGKIVQNELDFLRELVENGTIRTAIDRSYPLEKIVEAHRYVDKGHKRGNVVITVK
jgi:NADPH:quinone reductase-like Zn-dependent oxidoreductase